MASIKLSPARAKAGKAGKNGNGAKHDFAVRDLSLADVLQQHEAIHRQLINYLQSVPDELFTQETRFRHRLRLDTYSHYPKHAKAIREWRERLEPSTDYTDSGTISV